MVQRSRSAFPLSGEAGLSRRRYRRPPLIIAFLAPADRCNQRCPSCILDLVGEPVRSFERSPADFALLIEQLRDAEIPILSISFQGYEVTLPQSWPYVEAVFTAANRHGVQKGFVTNGMLLHKWADRICALDPERISVSLDGSDPATNDPIRGLSGAWRATTESVDRFLRRAPMYRDRLAVVSTLMLDRNLESLRAMPSLLQRLGLRRWSISPELAVSNGKKACAHAPGDVAEALAELRMVGLNHGLETHVVDEFGRLPAAGERDTSSFKSLYQTDFLVRVEPSGHVRVGNEIGTVFDPATARRFDPRKNHIAEVIGYRQREARFLQALRERNSQVRTCAVT